MGELLADYCFICVEKYQHLENIQEADDKNIKYIEKLKFCFPEQNWQEPFSICSNCIEKLNTVYNFIHLCKQSEALRQIKCKEIEKPALQQIEAEESHKNLFSCCICEKKFKQARFLKQHTTRVHSNNKSKINTSSSNTVINEDKCLKTEDSKELQKLENGFDQIEEEVFADYIDNSLETNSESEIKIPELEQLKKRKTQHKTKRKKDPFNCEYCGKLFNRRQHWSAHIRANHTFEKPYACTLCDARFINSQSLLVHKRNHNNEKPFVCSTCGKTFACSSDIYHHTKTHLNKRDYKCDLCGKCFNTASILRTHKIVKHVSPEKWKYSCHLCDRKFPIHSGLSSHVLRHNGEKNFSCHVCHKKFVSNSEVRRHLRCHSDERIFKCDLCDGVEYKQSDSLKKHLKIVHDVGDWKPQKSMKTFQCTVCGKVFSFNHKLRKHMERHKVDDNSSFKLNLLESERNDMNVVKREAF